MVEFQFKWQSGKERSREIECLHGVECWLPLWFNILGSLLNLEKKKKRSIFLYHVSSFKRGSSKMYKYADTKTTQEKFILVYHEMKY
jgi:hypothetical protein